MLDTLATLAELTPETVGQIVGYAVTAVLTGATTYGVCRKRHPQPTPESRDYATKAELLKLEAKHDLFEREMRTTLRDSEARTHKRLDNLSTKLDELIGGQKGDSRILNSLLSHLIHSHDLPQ